MPSTPTNKKISIPSTPNHTTPNHMPPNHMVPNDTLQKYQCTKPNTVMIIGVGCIFTVSAKYRIRLSWRCLLNIGLNHF